MYAAAAVAAAGYVAREPGFCLLHATHAYCMKGSGGDASTLTKSLGKEEMADESDDSYQEVGGGSCLCEEWGV